MAKPHGGKLINRNLKKQPSDIGNIPTFKINTNLSEDILNISQGIFSPLEGFLCNNDLENILQVIIGFKFNIKRQLVI